MDWMPKMLSATAVPVDSGERYLWRLKQRYIEKTSSITDQSPKFSDERFVRSTRTGLRFLRRGFVSLLLSSPKTSDIENAKM
jgi:hypothetical protein